MIKLICTILLSAFSALPVNANDLSCTHVTANDTTEINRSGYGKFALQLAASDFYTFKNIRANLNLKRHFNDNLALRLGLYANFKFSKGESGNNSSYSGYGTNLSIQYYFKPGSGISSYAIGGLQYDYEENDYNDAKHPDQLYSYGIMSGVGMEYFFIRSMSLFAEFSAVLAYEIEKEKIENEYESYGNVRLKDNSVSIGISFYF